MKDKEYFDQLEERNERKRSQNVREIVYQDLVDDPRFDEQSALGYVNGQLSNQDWDMRFNQKSDAAEFYLTRYKQQVLSPSVGDSGSASL